MVVGVSGNVEYQVRLEPPPARRWLLTAAALIIRGVSRVFGARVGRGLGAGVENRQRQERNTGVLRCAQNDKREWVGQNPHLRGSKLWFPAHDVFCGSMRLTLAALLLAAIAVSFCAGATY